MYGCSGGVLSIPPHLLEEVIKTGRKSKVKDICGFKLLSENKFTAAAIDRLVWTKKMLDLLVDFIKNDPQGKEFQDLDWSEEYELAKQGEAYGQSAL